MAEKKVKSNATYVYCGDGLGVPGLPHRVTREEAEARGKLADFEAAVERGDYRLVKPAESED